jgi:hypothetical protein
MGFASEPIATVLSRENSVTRDEAVYISLALATVLRDLQHDHNLIFGRCVPDNVFFTEGFCLKLGLFLHSVQFQSATARIADPFCPFSATSVFHYRSQCLAPEIVTDSTHVPGTDAYMYGLCVLYAFANKEIAEGAVQAATEAAPSSYTELLKSCTVEYAPSRPTFEAILGDGALTSMVAGVFQSLEVLDRKDSRDVYSFLTGLKKILDVFSYRLVRFPFLPIFCKLMKKDPRFGIVLIPTFFAIEAKFADDEFVEQILVPMTRLLKHKELPKLLELYLDHIDCLLARIPPERRRDFLYPVVIDALESHDAGLLSQVLISLPYMIRDMDDDLVRRVTLLLVAILGRCIVPTHAIAVISIFRFVAVKLDSAHVCEVALPAVADIWWSQKWNDIALPTLDLLSSLNLPIDVTLTTTLKLAADLLACRDIPPMWQARLMMFIHGTIRQCQADRNLDADDMEEAGAYDMQPLAYSSATYTPTDRDEGSDAEFSEDEAQGENQEEGAEEAVPTPPPVAPAAIAWPVAKSASSPEIPQPEGPLGGSRIRARRFRSTRGSSAAPAPGAIELD